MQAWRFPFRPPQPHSLPWPQSKHMAFLIRPAVIKMGEPHTPLFVNEPDFLLLRVTTIKNRTDLVIMYGSGLIGIVS